MAQKRMILKGSVSGDLFTKYGLDTNVLVDLILYPKAKEYFEKMRVFVSWQVPLYAFSMYR